MDLLPKVNFIQSPNCSERETSTIDLIVIHNISLPPKQFDNNFVVDFFSNKLDKSRHIYFEEISHLKVSTHIFIKRTGEIIQFVPFNKKAWHAGVSKFKNREDCNDFSIGIELEGSDDLLYEEAQYQALIETITTIKKHYPIKNIVGHSDIAPGRKTDPGKSFDWERINEVR
jgi:AmpD protein